VVEQRFAMVVIPAKAGIQGRTIALRHMHHGMRQVLPPRIDRFDEPNLPRAIPLLEAFFSLDRITRPRKGFAIHQPMDVVLLGETLQQALLVLPHPAREIIRHADVEGPIGLAGKNVNIILAAHRMVSGFPPSRE